MGRAIPQGGNWTMKENAMEQQNELSTRKRTLFEIGEELNAVAIAFDNAEDNESPQEVTDALESFFASVLDDRDSKLDAYASLISWNEHMADAAEDEARRLSGIAKVRNNRVARLKERLKQFFEASGITKIETPKHVFTIANNGGKLPLIIDDGVKPEEVSECFQKVTVDFNRDEIRNAIESGQDVQFARFGERGTNLRIR